jgi:hypothetical protein
MKWKDYIGWVRRVMIKMSNETVMEMGKRVRWANYWMK